MQPSVFIFVVGNWLLDPLSNLLKIIKTNGKGQIISKGLFGVLEFSQKINERIRCSM